MPDPMPDPMHHIDRLIDSALATYADAEARPELARRVLERIASQAGPRRRWLPWAIALPVAACCLILFAVHFVPTLGHRHAANPEQANASRQPLAEPGNQPAIMPRSTSPAISNVAIPRQHRQLTVAAAKLPKLDVFPTPQPLSHQEQALVVLVARTPQPELVALAKSQQQELPLTVASLHGKPLELPDEGTN